MLGEVLQLHALSVLQLHALYTCTLHTAYTISDGILYRYSCNMYTCTVLLVNEHCIYITVCSTCFQGERQRITREVSTAHDQMKALNTKLQELEERQEREGNVTECKTKCKSDMFFVNSYYNITSTKACNTVTQSISGKK